MTERGWAPRMPRRRNSNGLLDNVLASKWHPAAKTASSASRASRDLARADQPCASKHRGFSLFERRAPAHMGCGVMAASEIQSIGARAARQP